MLPLTKPSGQAPLCRFGRWARPACDRQEISCHGRGSPAQRHTGGTAAECQGPALRRVGLERPPPLSWVVNPVSSVRVSMQLLEVGRYVGRVSTGRSPHECDQRAGPRANRMQAQRRLHPMRKEKKLSPTLPRVVIRVVTAVSCCHHWSCACRAVCRLNSRRLNCWLGLGLRVSTD